MGLMLIFETTTGQEIPIRHFTTKDGLPSNNCYRLIDDADGRIWVSTDKGIVRYNGYEFESISEKLNFKIKDIYNCFPDDYGRMWLDTKDQRKKFIYKDSLIWVDPPGSPSSKEWSPLYYPGSGYFLTHKKRDPSQNLTIYKYGTKERYDLPVDARDLVMLVKENKNNISIVTYNKGVFLFDKTTLSYDTLALFEKGETHSSDNHNFYHPRYFGKDRYCFTTQKYVYMVEKDRVYKLFSAHELKGEEIIGFDDGWLVTHDALSGVFSKISVFGVREAIPLPVMPGEGTNLVVDREGNWWISSTYSGIFFIPRKSFKSRQYYQTQDAMTTPKITHMGWLEKNGLYLINDNFPYFLLKKDGKPEKISWHMAAHLYNLEEDKYGQIITGNFSFYSKSPLTVKGNDKIKPFTDLIRLGNWYFSRPYVIPKSNHIRSGNKGYYSSKQVFRLNDTTFLFGGCLSLLEAKTRKGEILVTDIQSPKECIYSILRLQDGQILLGTTNGIYTYSNKKMQDKWYDEKINGFIRSMVQDQNGLVWLSSDEKGLISIEPKTGEMNVYALFNNHIINKLFYNTFDQSIWIASSNGLWKATRDNQNRVVFKKFTYADGIHPKDINTVFCKKDSVFIGSSEGLTIMKDLTMDKICIPELEISGIWINGKKTTFQTHYDLSHFENSVTIQLTNFSYESLGENTYYYILKGTETPTKMATNERTIQLNNLAPGNYKFHAKAFNLDGVASKNEVAFSFKIHPVFYNTLWFRLSLATFLAFIPFLLFYVWNKRKLMANERELALQKKMAEIKLESLQSQLNSHFIFNSLNAIQNYIFTNEEVKANEYLSKFSRLIRGYLEASKKQFIGLFEEIELLQLYLSLESLRSGEHFEYSISIDDNLDNTVQIPSNIVQPFVENAIEHGLKNKDTKGYLKITWRAEGKLLICRVEDDGIGREMALQKKKNHLKKQSLGIKIIRERINAIREFDRSDIDVDIVDLYPDKVDKGTRVTIRMPLKISLNPTQ